MRKEIIFWLKTIADDEESGGVLNYIGNYDDCYNAGWNDGQRQLAIELLEELEKEE